jgi:hypothetical protein
MYTKTDLVFDFSKNQILFAVILGQNCFWIIAENHFEMSISSAIRLHRLMTVTTSLIQRELGNLSSQMDVEVSEKLSKLFEYKNYSKT